MAALTYKVGGDTSGLGRAMDRAKGMLSGLGASVRRLSIGGALAAGAASMASMYASARGLRSALDMGGRLSDVAANTGIAAGEALILERALQDAGMNGEKLQPIIQKMQRSIVEAGEGVLTYKKAFDALGLSLGDLRKMNPAEQFAAVQEALASIEDPAERTARAMQIFGRSGGELGALLSNPDALKNAAKSVGGQAEILNRSADSFDRASDLLSGMGTKLRGFFVGMADFINPVLLPVLEKFNAVDWSGIGQSVGRAVAMLIQVFKDGNLGDLVSASLMKAGKDLINFLWNGFLGLGSALSVFVKDAAGALTGWMDVLGDANFWGGLRSKFESMAAWMAKGFLDAIPETLGGNSPEESARLESKAKANNVYARNQFNAAFRDAELGGGFGNLSERMFQAWSDTVLANGPLISTAKERNKIGTILEGVQKAVEDQRAAVNKSVGKAGEDGGMSPDAEGMGGFVGRSVKPLVNSLARVGGASVAGLGGLSLDRERNKSLKNIEKNTAKLPGLGSMVAVYG